VKTCQHGINEKFCPKCKVPTGSVMSFQTASKFIVPFGKGKGRTIDEVARDNDGLMWLDWLYGERSGQRSPFDSALKVYMEDDSIQKELKKIGED
jgi:hypothetical protein